MITILKATDFALSRAGANSIFELLSNQVLTTFIPLPKNVSRGDQIDNAQYLESLGLSKTIKQENLTLNSFFASVEYLEKNAKSIKENIKNQHFIDGTAKIMQIILNKKIKH